MVKYRTEIVTPTLTRKIGKLSSYNMLANKQFSSFFFIIFPSPVSNIVYTEYNQILSPIVAPRTNDYSLTTFREI